MSMSVTMKPAVHDLLVCRLQLACWCVRRRARWTSCCGKPTCRWWWARRHGGNSSLKPSPSALVVWLHTQTSSSSTTLFVSLFHITDQSTHTLKEFLPRDAMQCGTCCRRVSICRVCLSVRQSQYCIETSGRIELVFGMEAVL